MSVNTDNKPKPEAKRPSEVRGLEDAPTRPVDALVDAAQRAAEQDQERVRTGMRAGTKAAAALADPLRAMEATARIGDVYRQAMEDSVEDMQALIACCAQLGQGYQQMQQTCLATFQRSMEQARRKPQDMLFKSPEELAEIQRDMYLDGVAVMLDTSTAMLRATGEMVRNAMRPLEARRH